MRFLSSDVIYPITSPPILNGIIVVDNEKIIDVIDPNLNDFPADASIEKFEGMLCPGFVNAHCHLELSHLGGQMQVHKGLTGFISEIVSKREADEDVILHAIDGAEKEMFDSGTSVVGDISNKGITISRKKKSKIHFHTFVELFDLIHERAETVFTEGIELQKKFEENNLVASLTPHAPYTVSEGLLKLIAGHAQLNHSPLSIHNQETESENEMFEKGSGKLFDQLKSMIKAFENWKPKEMSSIKYVDANLTDVKVQFVHNTFTRESDLKDLKIKKTYWCLCPRANLFIENQLPDIILLKKDARKITMGTDSYASNHSLSMLEEIKTIRTHFPLIPLDEILKWATYNGAEFLGVEEQFGSFVRDKQPGIVHIDKEMNTATRIH